MIKKITSVPHLTTALTGPLQLLEKHLLQHQTAIEVWFRQQWQKTPPPVYGSVDLRNAGFKLAPVDMNLFPAGFNNLNPDFLPLCIQAVQDTVEKCQTDITRILLVPENHTRNLFYLENLHTLQEIILKAGFEVRIGSLLPDLTKPQTIDLPSGKTIKLEPITKTNNRVGLENFDPCIIWLNNDLSSGCPVILKDIEQKIIPPMQLGWNNRLKSIYFHHYQSVAENLAEIIGIDPWLINPLFRKCQEIDFLKQEGVACLIRNTERLLHLIQTKYNEYKITQKPFVIIKADRGTYGMGVMTIQNPAELQQLNRKQRTKMAASKGGQVVNHVILQEGVYTFETIGAEEAVAEPVIYMIGRHVVGGFYRVHKNRGVTENLNAPGMQFEPLAFAECCNNPECDSQANTCVNRFYAYGVIARLCMLAAAREKEELMP
jgi:glutamate--cysteine ligase